MDKENVKKLIKESLTYDEVCKKMFGYSNGKVLSKIRNFVYTNNIDISHFDIKHKSRKYKIIEKVCPVCNTTFNTKEGHEREKITCSYKCSNTHFRSGKNNGSYREIDELTSNSSIYTRTCFKYHERKCIICGENNIVAVHHFDNNHHNNAPENLIPLCPTHHLYVHSSYKNLIFEKIEKFRNEFIKNFK